MLKLNRQQHIINRQIIEFTLPTKDDAQNIQESFSRAYKNFVLPVIERVCNKYSGSDEVIRIEKLDIDIGAINIDKISSEFPEKVEKRLEDILVKEIYEAKDKSNNRLHKIEHTNNTADNDKITKYINTPQADLEKLIHFLQSGTKPWYALGKENNSILSLIENLLIKSPDKLKETLSEVLKFNVPRKRLIFQFPVPLLKKIVDLLNPNSADFIFEFYNILEKINRHQTFINLSEEKLRNTILDLAVDFILVKQDKVIHTIEKKQFILFICDHLDKNVVSKIRKKYGKLSVIKSIKEGLNILKTKDFLTVKTSVEPLVHDLIAELESAETEDSIENINKKTNVIATNQEAEKEVPSLTSDQSDLKLKRSKVSEKNKNKEDNLEDLKFKKNKRSNVTLLNKNIMNQETKGKEKVSDKAKNENKIKNKEHNELYKIKEEESNSDLIKDIEDNKNERLQLNEKEGERNGYKGKIATKKVNKTYENVNDKLKDINNKSENIYYDNNLIDESKTKLKESTRESDQSDRSISNNIKAEDQYSIKQKKPDTFLPNKFKFVSVEEQHIDNAGLVLLWTFLNRFFTLLGYVKNNQFIDPEAKYRAIHVLQYLVTGQEETPEHDLILNKLLCGLDIDEPIPAGIKITEFEKEECNNLLQAVIDNWKALKKTSIESLQITFLQKEGILLKQSNGWKLSIERNTVDILLDRLSWSISVIVLPWSKEILYVEW